MTTVADEITTIQINKKDRDALKRTLALAHKKSGLRRYYMSDLIHDMNEHYFDYLKDLVT